MPVWILDIVVLTISGFFGKKAFENTGSIMIVITIVVMIAANGLKLGAIVWGVIYWLIGMFIGFAIVTTREVIAESKDKL